jgi:hypothetical protein
MSNEVNTFYVRQAELKQFLLEQKNLSMAQDVEQMLQKNLPLAAASYFEHLVCGILRKYIDRKSHSSPELKAFFEIKAISRQYHTLFDWDKSNVNKFLSHFGENFKSEASREIGADPELTKSAQAFIEIGSIRNRIVHQNYAAFVVDKSSEEVFALFQLAERFVVYIESKLLPPAEAVNQFAVLGGSGLD